MWELDYKKGWALKNWCFLAAIFEKFLDSLLDCKEIKPSNPKGNQSWIFIGRPHAEPEALILWPLEVNKKLEKSWYWERWKAKEEKGDRWWGGWMASQTQSTWVWVNSRRWWRAWKPGVLPSMGSQRVRHHLATEQQQHSASHLSQYQLIETF